jgi:hypothetical protein
MIIAECLSKGYPRKILADSRPEMFDVLQQVLIANCRQVSMVNEVPRSCVYGIGDQLIALARAAVRMSSRIGRKALSHDPHRRDTQ